LAAASVAYAASNLLLARGSVAGRERSQGGRTGGIAATLRQPAYLAGTVGQAAGFLLALGARRELPLLVVQSGVTASLALTAVGGALLGRWRLGWGRTAAVTAVVAGLVLAASAGRPGRAVDPGIGPLVGCLAAVLLSLALLPDRALARVGVPDRLRPAVQGLASGVGFGASAVGARVAVGEVLGATVTPADALRLVTSAVGVLSLVLLVGGVVVGQVLLTAALASGAVTGPVAAMHVVENAAPAAIGVLLLGDVVAPGGGRIAVLGVALALVGSVRLAGHDAPEPSRGQYR
jgi:drug/metabolite transporter (DMT)-like permease